MKNKLLNILILLLLCFPLYAENITREQAKQKALEFFKINTPSGRVQDVKLVYESKNKVKSATATPALYIFDNPNGNGFVILSGDDIAYPVLGYSYENKFPENIPAHVQSWIDGMEASINWGRENGVKAPVLPDKTLQTTSYVVKLNTVKWDQGDPYNRYTPTINGQKTPVGCTATATGIVMRYHKYPDKGRGIIPGYASNSVSISAKALGHAYDWDNMLETYTYNQYTDQQANNVAELLYEIGIALESEYGVSGTGALPNKVTEVLSKHFKYSKSALFHQRREYSTDDWYKLVKKELDANRPVFYSGYNEEAGHAFVLDGYTSDNFFSVNWGWSGNYNGNFMLDALYPEGSGIGGNGSHYNNGQGCIVNLIPEDSGEYISKLSLGEKGMTITLDATQTVIEKEKPFKVTVDALWNTGSCQFIGQYMLGVTDANGSLKEPLQIFTIDYNTGLLPGWGFQNLEMTVKITNDIAPGDRIRNFYKAETATDYTLIKGGENCTWEVVIKEGEGGEEDTQPSIAETTSITYNKENKVLTIQTGNNVSVGFFSSNNTDLSSNCNTQNNTTTISTQNLAADTYLIKLTRGSEVEEVKVKLN